MVMRRKKSKQSDMWVPNNQVAQSPGHRFYEKLNELLAEQRFDERVEAMCLRIVSPSGFCVRESPITTTLRRISGRRRRTLRRQTASADERYELLCVDSPPTSLGHRQQLEGHEQPLMARTSA